MNNPMEPSMNPTFQLPDWVAYSFAIVAFTVVANGILMHHIRVGENGRRRSWLTEGARNVASAESRANQSTDATYYPKDRAPYSLVEPQEKANYQLVGVAGALYA